MNGNNNFIRALSQLYVIDKQGIYNLLNKHGYYIYTEELDILLNVIQDSFVYNNDFQNDLLDLIKEKGINRSSAKNEYHTTNRLKLTINNKLKFNQFIQEEHASKNREILFIISFITLFYLNIIKNKK